MTVLKEGNKRIIVFAVFVLLTISWMMVIFGFSSNTAEESTDQSHGVTEIIIRIFNWDFDDLSPKEQQDLVAKYDGTVRKIAHFVSYGVLGFLMYFSVYTFPSLHYNNICKPAALSLPLSIVFALTDEYHQTFVDGRAGQLTDILIDGLGAVCGTAASLAALMIALGFLKNKTQNRDA